MRLLEQVDSSSASSGRDHSVSISRLIICLALFAAMIWSGGTAVRSGVTGPRPRSANPYYSTDAYLQAITGASNASQRVVDVIGALPKDKPLLIFQRERDSGSALLGMTLAYLSWPDNVRIQVVRGNNCERQLAGVSPDSVAAVAFCDLPMPTWIQGGIRLGSTSRLLPMGSTNDRP